MPKLLPITIYILHKGLQIFSTPQLQNSVLLSFTSFIKISAFSSTAYRFPFSCFVKRGPNQLFSRSYNVWRGWGGGGNCASVISGAHQTTPPTPCFGRPTQSDPLIAREATHTHTHTHTHTNTHTHSHTHTHTHTHTQTHTWV